MKNKSILKAPFQKGIKIKQMKKYIFFLLAVFSLQIAAFSQSDKYVAAMQKNLVLFDSAKTVEDFTKAANTFERIGDAEKTQWLPYYYAGLTLSISGWMPAVTDKDANSARINAFCDKAESVAVTDADKAEIQTIRNMSATQQMMVDPQTRWMSLWPGCRPGFGKRFKIRSQ